MLLLEEFVANVSHGFDGVLVFVPTSIFLPGMLIPDSLAVFFDKGRGSQNHVQTFAGECGAQRTGVLILCQVGQKVGDHQYGILVLFTDGDGNSAAVLTADNAVQCQRNGDPLVLADAAVMMGLEIDYDARRVFIKSEEIKLTQTEYNIVALLSENCGKMMTYAAIIKAIWGGNAHEGNTKKLQVNMANIRRKFGAQPGEANYIINELGVGYRMNGERE